MAGEALRSVFAEFGVTLDDKQLSDVQKKIDGAAKKVRTFPSLRGAVDLDAVDKGTKHLTDRLTALRTGFDRARGEKLHAQLTKLSPRFAALSRQAGLGSDHMAEFGRVVARVSGVVVASLTASAAAAFLFGRAFTADAMALRETSRAARVSTTEMQSFTLAGERAGVSAEATTAALNTLAEGLRAIESRTGGPVGALWRLGVRSRDTSGRVRATGEVLADLADRFDKVTRPAARLRLATELFGSSARQMLEVLRGGRGTLASAREELAALGGGILPEATEEARKFSVAQTRMRLATDSVRSVFAVGLLPALTWVTEKVALVTGWFARMARGSRVVEVALSALGIVGAAAGVAVLVAWAPVLVPLLKVVGIVSALVLIFDDLITFIEGGDSATGRLIDSLFGVGKSRVVLEWLRETWEAIANAIERAQRALDRYVNDDVYDGMNRRATARRQDRPTEDNRTSAQRTGDLNSYLEFTRRQNAARAGAAPAPSPAAALSAPARLPAAPSGGARGGNVVHRTDNSRTVIQVTGITDPHRAAERVAQILEERQRQRRDGGHPSDAED